MSFDMKTTKYKKKLNISDVAVAVILYNPISSYLGKYEELSQLGLTIFVDNSEVSAKAILQSLKFEYLYIHNSNKGGIAGALNISALQAYNLGFKWLLTVDQDSGIRIQSFFSALEFLNTQNSANVSVCAPLQDHMLSKQREYNFIYKEKYKEIDEAMTSGSLLNLEIYKMVGPFNEKFFIDAVDQEYCVRSRLKGFKIVEIQDYLIDHSLGNLDTRSILGIKFGVTNHSKKRYYYIVRNTLKLIFKYKKLGISFVLKKIIFLIKMTIKILLFEECRIGKIFGIFLGFTHFLTGRMGQV